MNWRRRLAYAGVALFLGFVTVAPFFLGRHGNVPETHDMAQHVSVLEQFDAAIRSGSLYPRWESEFNNGYGLPWLNYYPPGFYYFAEPFYLALGDPIRALFASCVIMMAASVLAFYAFARLFTSRVASAAGALLYALAPYHTADLYWRGALPELTGFVFVPLVLYFAFRAAERGCARDIAALGLAHGAYVFCHFAVAYLLTITLVAYALAWTLMTRRIRVAMRIAAGVFLGFTISAAYWLVALRERIYVREPFSAQFPYHASYVTLLPGDAFAAVINNSFLGVAAGVLAALFVTRGAALPDSQRLLRYFAAGTLFMVTPYSIYISRLIPNIDAISFAWRWLVIAACFSAVVVAMSFDVPRWRLLVAAVLALNAVFSIQMIRGALRNRDLVAPLMRQEYGFLPGGATDPPSMPDSDRATVSSGSVDIASWLPLRRELAVKTPAESVLRLKTLMFPGWRAWIDGKRTELAADSYGAQVIRVPAGSHRVEVRFGRTHVRNVAGAISLAGLVIAFACCLFDFVSLIRPRRGA